jgi:hypothetical protein
VADIAGHSVAGCDRGGNMDYLFLLVGLIAGINAYTYAVTVREDRNMAGTAFIYCIIALSIGLPIYRIVANP